MILPLHSCKQVDCLQAKWPVNFAQLSAKAIIKALTDLDPSVLAVSKFIFSLVEHDSNQSCTCCKDFISKALVEEIKTPSDASKLVIDRIKVGLKLLEGDRNEFLENSRNSYDLIRRIFEGSEGKLGELVEDIIQLDEYSDCEQSSYLLREIGQLFARGE